MESVAALLVIAVLGLLAALGVVVALRILFWIVVGVRSNQIRTERSIGQIHSIAGEARYHVDLATDQFLVQVRNLSEQSRRR